MANRCPDCNKFVSLDLDQDNVEIEFQGIEDQGNGKATMTLSVHLAKVCSECGTEISAKDQDIDVEVDLAGFEEV